MTAETASPVAARPARPSGGGRALFRRIVKLGQSPLAVLVAVVAGVLTGLYLPAFALALTPISDTYVGLLKMVVLPFIVSSIIFSLRALIHDPRAGSYLTGVFLSVIGVSALAVLVGGALALVMQPGVIEDRETAIALGHIVNQGTAIHTDLQMALNDLGGLPTQVGIVDALLTFIPDNVFHALSEGDTVKVLVFSLLFGFAVGSVPSGVSRSMSDALDTVYRTCLTLTNWFNYFLPLATFTMIAGQTAATGLGTLWLMVDFLLVIGLAALIITLVCFAIVAANAKTSMLHVLKAHQNVLVMAIATRSSTACIPATIETLVTGLAFAGWWPNCWCRSTPRWCAAARCFCSRSRRSSSPISTAAR
ncbi:dicarboxylate/amino acid:cation symporter [Methylobrevis pamukkalensis]|uniref:Proton glutamate symport protein n=1 Tax=Methylobrevis pamukkalensis TaxID=1439726 RepID=A0A1E3H1G8_9HYPH|nr:cation:dicarboxylase symporter family transporter [Methylobrevis pamukkalensis]ODN70173.1 Proton glutamate symport protein [Methylobrevis pamukkalensis]